MKNYLGGSTGPVNPNPAMTAQVGAPNPPAVLPKKTPWDIAPSPVAPPSNMALPGVPGAGGAAAGGDPGAGPSFNETTIGGISAVNPEVQPFDYGAVSGFADAAWQQAQRYLKPQMMQEDQRFAQDLINQGIDPNSPAGKSAFQRKAMSQNDLQAKAAYDALGFGTNLQNQMYGQGATTAGLAGDLLKAKWQGKTSVYDTQTQAKTASAENALREKLGLSEIEFQRYKAGKDAESFQAELEQAKHQFDTEAQQQANRDAFGQMLGLEGIKYRDYQSQVDEQRYRDSLALALGRFGTPGTAPTSQSGLPAAPGQQYQQQMDYWSQF